MADSSPSPPPDTLDGISLPDKSRKEFRKCSTCRFKSSLSPSSVQSCDKVYLVFVVSHLHFPGDAVEAETANKRQRKKILTFVNCTSCMPKCFASSLDLHEKIMFSVIASHKWHTCTHGIQKYNNKKQGNGWERRANAFHMRIPHGGIPDCRLY